MTLKRPKKKKSIIQKIDSSIKELKGHRGGKECLARIKIPKPRGSSFAELISCLNNNQRIKQDKDIV